MAKKKSSKKKKKYGLFKKIARIVYYSISGMYVILDKVIITPLAKLMVLIMKPFKGASKPLDRFLNNKMVLITISLLIALLAFYHYDNIADRLSNNTADILYNQKVKALYNEEAYVVEGLPKTVDITLIGRKADLYLAKQYPSEDVVVDLRDLKPGKHKVNLKYSGSVSSVEYKLDPSATIVTIYEKMSESKEITKELLYEDKLNSEFTITDITFDRNEVYVKGAEYKLKQIATVKALVDIRKIDNPTVGKTTLKDIPLIAYDENGAKLNVEIVPKTISATIEITSPSKTVPIKVIPEGTVEFGKAIDDIKLSATKATIYGDEDVLDKISYLPVSIDVSNLSKDEEFTLNISAPSGVKKISTKSVVATVTLGTEKEKILKNINIATKNLGKNLTAQAASKNDSSASIIVKGTSNNLKDVTAENISAYVDLQGLEKGTHKVEVKVTGEDLKLSYTPKTTEVTIIIK